MSETFEWMNAVVVLLGAVTSFGLAAAVLIQRRRGLVQWTLGLGMLMFGLEALASHVLLTVAEAPEQRIVWLKVVLVGGLLATVPWGAFGASISYASPATWPRTWRFGLAIGGA